MWLLPFAAKSWTCFHYVWMCVCWLFLAYRNMPIHCSSLKLVKNLFFLSYTALFHENVVGSWKWVGGGSSRSYSVCKTSIRYAHFCCARTCVCKQFSFRINSFEFCLQLKKTYSEYRTRRSRTPKWSLFCYLLLATFFAYSNSCLKYQDIRNNSMIVLVGPLRNPSFKMKLEKAIDNQSNRLIQWIESKHSHKKITFFDRFALLSSV